jgi:hypothetical protein
MAPQSRLLSRNTGCLLYIAVLVGIVTSEGIPLIQEVLILVALFLTFVLFMTGRGKSAPLDTEPPPDDFKPHH